MTTNYPPELAKAAGDLWAAGDHDGAVALLDAEAHRQWLARLAADAELTKPALGRRVFAAIHGASGPGLIGLFSTLGAHAMGAHYAAPAIFAVTLAISALGALGGFVTGGST